MNNSHKYYQRKFFNDKFEDIKSRFNDLDNSIKGLAEHIETLGDQVLKNNIAIVANSNKIKWLAFAVFFIALMYFNESGIALLKQLFAFAGL